MLNKRRPFHPRILLGIQLPRIKLPIFQSLLSTGDTLEDIITFIYWIRQNWRSWAYLWRPVYYTESHTLNKPHPILTQGPVSLQHIFKVRQFYIKRQRVLRLRNQPQMSVCSAYHTTTNLRSISCSPHQPLSSLQNEDDSIKSKGIWADWRWDL